MSELTVSKHTSQPAQKQSRAKEPARSTRQSSGFEQAAAIGNLNLVDARSVIRLQRTIGNRATSRLLGAQMRSRGPGSVQVQFKLMVGPADDAYEREADQMAEQVLRTPDPSAVSGLSAPDDLPIQREAEPQPQNSQPPSSPAAPPDPRAGFEADESIEHEIADEIGRGQPLPESVRAFMEPRFGADLGRVRVHTGQNAEQLNRKLSAQAFTHGTDIFFASGKFSPGTTAGNRLLAHELTHVIQQGAAPVRRQYRPAADGLLQRTLTAESRRAFGSAVAANPKYEHGRRLVDKFAVPENEPETGSPVPWQTTVREPIDQDNVTTGEQDKINKMGRTHGFKLWKKADEQERKLKDFVRAFILWDFASRTNQLRPVHPTHGGGRYSHLGPADKAKKRKSYMAHAEPFQEKFKGLIDKGPAAPETQTFLKQEGFLEDMNLTAEQRAEAQAEGPRIDVRSTFIGGSILGIHVRAHLFIVYTGRDGRQFYFRGGPGEQLDPDDPTDCGYTTVDYGEYTADTIDYDPSAPSVTVLSGEAAEAKFDAMIEAARALNAMQVPYRAVVEPRFAKLFKKDSLLRQGMSVFGTRGENCNRAAWTILDRAGIPKKKPFGKHPGWGAPLGSDTPGKEGAMPEVEQDDPSTAKKITLDAKRDMAVFGQVQVYMDRMLFQKSDVLPVGTEVEELADEVQYRKIRYGDGKVGYIAKRTSDQQRTLRMRLKAALIKKNWYAADKLQELADEITGQNYRSAMELLQELKMDGRDFKSMQEFCEALATLKAEFGKSPEQVFNERLDDMSEAQVRNLNHDFEEMWGLIRETGIDAGEALKQVEARIGELDRRDRVIRLISEQLEHPAQLNTWVNDYPDYTVVREVAQNSGEDEEYVVKVMDSLRPAEVQGNFIEKAFEILDYDYVQRTLERRDEPATMNWLKATAQALDVPVEFLIRRFEKYAELHRPKAEEEEAAEGASPFEGMLTPPPDRPIQVFDIAGDECGELTKPVRVKILEEDYKTRQGWEHILITAGGQTVKIYADALHQYFSPDAKAGDEGTTGGELEEVLDEGALEWIQEPVDDFEAMGETFEQVEGSTTGEAPQSLPISEQGLQVLKQGGDLQMLVYSFGLDIEQMRRLTPVQLKQLASIMGKSIEDVEREIAELEY